jgi:hypothetical protein
MVVFFAAMYQLFLVNDSIYKAITAVHREVFARGFAHNCFDYNNPNCRYDPRHARIVWSRPQFPEIRVGVTPMFRGPGGLPSEVLIENGPGRPKRTEMASGTAGPGTGPAAIARLFGKQFWAVSKMFDPAFFTAYPQRVGAAP